MSNERKNNQVTITGTVRGNMEFSHAFYGENYYSTLIETQRFSKTRDVLPLMIPERLADTGVLHDGSFVTISGQFRSFNKHEGERSRLILYVYVQEITPAGETAEASNNNKITLNGFLCKPPVYRKTPLGREITDVILAVSRPNGKKSDYIPCIFWGRNAREASGMNVGDPCSFTGRIQSREYMKKISEEQIETRTAYEVSVGKMVEAY